MECRKLLLLLFNFVSVLLFSGTVFGWTSFSALLLEERFYEQLCPAGTTAPCDAQRVALNRAFTLASTATGLCALPGGWLLDAAGPFWTICVGGIIEIASLICIALSESVYKSSGVDLFPAGLVGIAVAGTLVRYCGYACGLLFPERTDLLIALASVLFDGSCMVFPVIKVIYDLGLSFELVLWFYTAFGVVVFALLSIGWWLNSDDMAAIRKAAAARQRAQSADNLCPAGVEGPSPESKSRLERRPFSQQLCSLEFLAIFVFSTVQLTRSNLYIGSVDGVNLEIAQATDRMDALPFVSTVVSFVIPLGFFAVPAITASVRNLGNAGTLVITLALGALVNALQLVPNLYLQMLTVSVFACFRAFLFSNVPQYNRHYFGVLSMGRVQGLCFLSGGIMNLVQVPLINWALIGLHGDFQPLLLICLAANVVPLIPCAWLVHGERLRKHAAARDSARTLLASDTQLVSSAEAADKAAFRSEDGQSLQGLPAASATPAPS
eukprot:TRINITY_DN39031_c0_g1_i1.p1 TRINITY_DN39031_c0_g1~~TRINITY_DN39031_c0_g1_i1.p1  ORF type:complete len:495 (+),score=59.39 TRINITY_DN39031_c0_g1_i1:45-1529(+)